MRSFPGPGDVEILELGLSQPLHVAADRGGKQGLCLVGKERDAAASFTYQPPGLDLTGAGLDSAGAEPHTERSSPWPSTTCARSSSRSPKRAPRKRRSSP